MKRIGAVIAISKNEIDKYKAYHKNFRFFRLFNGISCDFTFSIFRD
jgi:hypothetical protein